MKTRSRKSAFTLIELLTVIAIIGILAAILIPTVGAVKKRAIKSQCASNLRQLGTAINLYLNDNKQKLPNGEQPAGNPLNNNSSQLQWLFSSQRKALMSYGMAYEMFFCKGNEAYTNKWMTDDQRNATGDQNQPIGYMYLPGTNIKIKDSYGRPAKSKYIETRITKINYRLIAADINRMYNNTFDGGVNHADTLTPFGGNHLYVDGAVKWIPASQFLANAALRATDGTEYYFKTED